MLVIEKSGLQFVTWQWTPDFEILKRQRSFHYFDQFVQMDSFRWFVEPLKVVDMAEQGELLLKESDFSEVTPRLNLAKQGLLDSDGIDELFRDIRGREVQDPSKVSNFAAEIAKWVGHWIPVPAVEQVAGLESQLQASLAPRMFIEATEQGYEVTMCLNTGSSESGTMAGRSFCLPENTSTSLLFLHERESLTGRLNYLEDLYYKNEEAKMEGRGRHIASYCALVAALEFGQIGKVRFASATAATKAVDCFIDLGNANTSVVLQEEHLGAHNFFGKSVSLELRDFKRPSSTYSGSFPSKVVFEEEKLASNGFLLDQEEFDWPSPARVGMAAEKLIAANYNASTSANSFLSSPKRYLWDMRKASDEWCYSADEQEPKNVNLLGYSESGVLLRNAAGDRLQDHGDLEDSGKQFFSKSSINRFFFIEVLQHAMAQINSTSFRSKMGDMQIPRRLRHVVVSCPTGMLQAEQAQLRKYAEEALAFLTNHPTYVGLQDSGIHPAPSVHPSQKDIKQRLDSLSDRAEWMYDEATCVQLLYLYGTLQHQFGKNVNSFTSTFDHAQTSGVRIGVVDLGGGTCDIMVCDHKCEEENGGVLVTPKPVFWDSWMRAGDDLRRELIEEHLVPNLMDHCQSKGFGDPESTIRSLIGSEQGQYDHQRITLLRNFMQQIAVPVTDIYLRKLNADNLESLGYSKVFGEDGVKEDLRERILALTNIDLTDVVWTIDPAALNRTVRKFFAAQLKAISGILGSLDCDLVLLAGGTFKISSLENEFHRGMGVLKSRVINLNHWKPGNWHPFTDERGNLNDTKSCVTLGSAVALHAGHTNTLPGFSLNTRFLKTDVTSTARCVWRDGGGQNGLLMKANEDNAVFGADTLPVKLDVSSIGSPNYLTKPAYKIHINKQRIERDLRSQGLSDRECEVELNNKIQSINMRAPFEISLLRDRGEGYESIAIDEVNDREENSIPKGHFELIRQSLPEEEYWIERGVNIKATNHG